MKNDDSLVASRSKRLEPSALISEAADGIADRLINCASGHPLDRHVVIEVVENGLESFRLAIETAMCGFASESPPRVPILITAKARDALDDFLNHDASTEGEDYSSFILKAIEAWCKREPQPKRIIEGTWPEHCEQRAFVYGAKWWQFHTNGSTMFSSECHEAEREAVRRYGEPGPKVEDAEIVHLLTRWRNSSAANLSALYREIGDELVTALEQQIKTRQEGTAYAELYPLALRRLVEKDREIERLENRCELLRAALQDAVYTVASSHKVSIGSIDNTYTAQIDVNQVEQWRDVLTTPTQSGEPVHDWAWALDRLETGDHVTWPEAAARRYLYLDESRLICMKAKRPDKGDWYDTEWVPHVLDFERTNWQLASVDAEDKQR